MESDKKSTNRFFVLLAWAEFLCISFAIKYFLKPDFCSLIKLGGYVHPFT